MLQRASITRAATVILAAAGTLFAVLPDGAGAQERLPWERSEGEREIRPYEPRREAPAYGGGSAYGAPVPAYAGRDDTYRAPPAERRWDGTEPRNRAPVPYSGEPQQTTVPSDLDEPYARPPAYPAPYYGRQSSYDTPPPPSRSYDEAPADGTFSMREITEAGHGFFGSISQGLASVIEYAFKTKGRPNGYILGEDAGGAFVAGLRYGEGRLYTRDAGQHRIFWQGPSVGYDAGAEGSKVMVLVYNLRDVSEIYQRFGGVAGSAYVVGGVGLTFQSNGDVVLAPIRAGIGLRLGANIGYLKYSRRPTWNPF